MKIISSILTLVLFSLGFAAVLTISSCEKTIHSIPVIDSLRITPDTVDAGGIAMISVVASDADGEDIAITYSPAAGLVSGTGTPVYWLAPAIGGTYAIAVNVTDATGNIITKYDTLIVRNSGKSDITGTASFPEGENFNLAFSKVRLFATLADRQNGNAVDSTEVFGFGPIVSFKLPQVAPGTYYLDVWKDIDNSLTISTGDYIGWYGSGSYLHPVLQPVVIEQDVPTQLQLQMGVMQ
jgi:hypothetical protein